MPTNITAPQKRFVYVDEYGDPNLKVEKDGTTQYFVCTAVILAEENLKSADEKIAAIRKAHFGGGEIKSSSASVPERRLKVLKELSEINFQYIALLVDKDKIWRDSGLQYKKTFYKHIHKRLYSILREMGVSLVITADKIGGLEFMTGFHTYIDTHVMPTLFSGCEFKFGDSKEVNFLQLSDFITGTLGHSFDPKKRTEFSPLYREAIRDKELALDAWPPYFEARTPAVYPAGSRHDPFIEKISYAQASEFIEKHCDSGDSAHAAQIDALMFLVYAKWGKSEEDAQKRYHTDTILAHLVALNHKKMTDQDFRREVVGPLRDAGVLISGNRNGYILATTMEEVEDFLKHGETIVFPMLNRIATATRTIKLATSGGCDILSNPEHTNLNKLIEKYSDLKCESNPEESISDELEPTD